MRLVFSFIILFMMVFSANADLQKWSYEVKSNQKDNGKTISVNFIETRNLAVFINCNTAGKGTQLILAYTLMDINNKHGYPLNPKIEVFIDNDTVDISHEAVVFTKLSNEYFGTVTIYNVKNSRKLAGMMINATKEVKITDGVIKLPLTANQYGALEAGVVLEECMHAQKVNSNKEAIAH